MPKRQPKGLRLRDGVLPENQRQVWEAVRGLQCNTRRYRAKYTQWSRLGNRDETKIPRINLRPQNLLENKYTQPPPISSGCKYLFNPAYKLLYSGEILPPGRVLQGGKCASSTLTSLNLAVDAADKPFPYSCFAGST